jgi:hypothetical protein
MALSLGVSEGSQIRVGTNIVTVHATRATPGTLVISVSVDGGPIIDLDELHKVALLPDVDVFVGRDPERNKQSFRLAFIAPKHIRIDRLQGPEAKAE